MVPERQLGDVLRAGTSLQDGADALIAAANERGGKDNITVVMFRLGQDRGDVVESDTLSGQETGVDQIDAGEVRAAVAAAEGSRAAPSARSDPTATAVIDPATASRARAASATEVRRIRPGADRQHDPTEVPRGRPVLEHGARRRGLVRRGPIVALLTLLCVAGLGVGLYAGSRQFYFLGTNERGLVTLYRGVPYSGPFGLKLYTEEHTTTVPARTVPQLQREAVLDHELRQRGDAVDLVRQLERTRGAG
jgi:protein phosphatase